MEKLQGQVGREGIVWTLKGQSLVRVTAEHYGFVIEAA
jgi:hypothetical protein